MACWYLVYLLPLVVRELGVGSVSDSKLIVVSRHADVTHLLSCVIDYCFGAGQLCALGKYHVLHLEEPVFPGGDILVAALLLKLLLVPEARGLHLLVSLALQVQHLCLMLCILRLHIFDEHVVLVRLLQVLSQHGLGLVKLFLDVFIRPLLGLVLLI